MDSKNLVPITKIHSYNVSVAMDVGINAAVIFYNICFWVEENMANERNLINGKYWTYNTVKAFQKIFPEMTSNQISYALKKLEDNGYIESAHLNDDPYDRTKYYTVCNIQKWISEISKMDNRNFQNVNIYNSNINTNTDKKHDPDNNNADNSHHKVFSNEKTIYNNKVSRYGKPHHSPDISYNYTEEEFKEFITQKVSYLIEEVAPEEKDSAIEPISAIISYFYKRYYECIEERHPILTDVVYTKIILNLIDPIDAICKIDLYLNAWAYCAMIDQFFKTDYGVKSGNTTDYRMPYFMSDKVQENLVYQSGII